MLSLFPQILFLAPAGTTLIRIAAGLAILYTGWMFYENRHAIARERFPLIGTCPPWLSMLGSTIYIVIGTLLVVGAWTQLAAIFGALVALKSVIFAKRYVSVMPLSRAASLLLLAMMLSIVVSGAGAFSLSIGGTSVRTAFDLPL